jgi:AAA+ ATPase superfamily predicted ATPase
MQYPLIEKIGDPELFVGREKEFSLFNKWLSNIPKRLSKSRVILARRKSGKTALVQRIFNQLWSENGRVIPFYFSFEEHKIWYPDLAIKYYCAFASQYISFLERDENLVMYPLSLEGIRKYGEKNEIKPLVNDVDSLRLNEQKKHHDLMWDTASNAPHRYAAVLNTRFLVILDEFQYITQYVYPDKEYKTAPIETMAGSFHSLAESKMAPMLVTGSYASWLHQIIDQYLEAGRLKHTTFSPYLAEEEGLQAVYQYAHFLGEPITNETALQINQLCLFDPFFIACVIDSDYEDKDLTTKTGVIDTVNYEISDRQSEMSKTWNEYLLKTLKKVNDRYAKSLLLFLNKHADRYWTPQELKKEIGLPLEIDDIQHRLVRLSEADVIERGSSDIQFRGLTDGTLNLILRNRLEEEIQGFVPNLKQAFNSKLSLKDKSLQGQLNHLSGAFAEYQLAIAFRFKRQFALDYFFQNVTDNTLLNLTIVKQRVRFKPMDAKGVEIDIVAESDCGRVVLVEVKKRQQKTNAEMVI